MVHPQVGNILQALMGVTSNVFREFPKIVTEMHSAYVKKLEELKNQLEKTEKESLDLLAATELLEKTTIRQASKLKQQQRDREIKIPGSMPGTRPISPAGSTGSNESKGRKINTHNYQNFIENLSKSTVIFIFNNSIINIVL